MILDFKSLITNQQSQLDVGNAHARERAAVAARFAKPLPALLLEHAQLRAPRLSVDNANDLRVRHKRRDRDVIAGGLLDEQHLLEGEFLALLAGGAVYFDDGAGRDLHLAAARLDDRVHVIPLNRVGGSKDPPLHYVDKGFILTALPAIAKGLASP